MLVEGDGAEEGEVDMAVRREKRDQREQTAQDQGDPALDIEEPIPAHAGPKRHSLGVAGEQKPQASELFCSRRTNMRRW